MVTADLNAEQRLGLLESMLKEVVRVQSETMKKYDRRMDPEEEDEWMEAYNLREFSAELLDVINGNYTLLERDMEALQTVKPEQYEKRRILVCHTDYYSENEYGDVVEHWSQGVSYEAKKDGADYEVTTNFSRPGYIGFGYAVGALENLFVDITDGVTFNKAVEYAYKNGVIRYSRTNQKDLIHIDDIEEALPIHYKSRIVTMSAAIDEIANVLLRLGDEKRDIYLSTIRDKIPGVFAEVIDKAIEGEKHSIAKKSPVTIDAEHEESEPEL